MDGEGRITSAGGGSQLASTTYNTASQPTAVNFPSGDSDSFTYDPNTGRETQYKFNVNSQSVTGQLNWNANGTLKSLAITDPFNSFDNQTCNYSHDDLNRIASANCGAIWSQTFSYADAFGNLTKSGTSSFSASYSPATNRMTSIGSSTPSYDANGNVTNDFLHTYSWNAEGRPVTIDGVGVTYDALGRTVELNKSGIHTEIQYSPTGFKMELMNGQTFVKAFVPMPGGTAEVWTPSATYYRHADWLGSVRLTSTTSRAVLGDVAYAPYGETYAASGNNDFSWTGINADVEPANPETLYDFPAREYGIQGRWPSPDPAGLGAVNLGDPQSWNRYAYVDNNPLVLTDPTGTRAEGFCVFGPQVCTLVIIADILEIFKLFWGHHHHAPPPPPHAPPAPQGGYGAGIDPYGTWDESLPAGVQVFPHAGFPGISGINPGGSGCPYGSGSCGGGVYSYTGQVGVSVGGNLWGYTFSIFAGIAVDLHGHIAVYRGAGYGATGAGTSVSGGVQLGGSNGYTVCSLKGPFYNVSAAGGDVISGTGDVFVGKGAGPGGNVVGGGATLGVGGGASASGQRTNTHVTPIIGSASCGS